MSSPADELVKEFHKTAYNNAVSRLAMQKYALGGRRLPKTGVTSVVGFNVNRNRKLSFKVFFTNVTEV